MKEEKLYGRILDTPSNMKDAANPEESFAATLKEAKLAVTSPRAHDQQYRIERLSSRWGTRNIDRDTNLATTLPDMCTVVAMLGDYNLANWQHTNPSNSTYIIPGDYHYGKITGRGVYVCDIHDGKFLNNSIPKKKLHIYFGNLTGRWKRAQSEWVNGDIRSYKHIDISLYKHLYDPGSGIIPNVSVITCILARSHQPEIPVVLYNADMNKLSHHDQMVLNRLGVQII